LTKNQVLFGQIPIDLYTILYFKQCLVERFIVENCTKARKNYPFVFFVIIVVSLLPENPLAFNSQTTSDFYQQPNIPKNQNLRK
jgi:hypothetical protein